MADLIERLRLQAKIGLFDAANTPGHVVASYEDAAAEIERLTVQIRKLEAALQDIIDWDGKFRSSMPIGTEKDQVTLACDRARTLLQV